MISQPNMTVHVQIPTPLRHLTQDRATVTASGTTIAHIMDDLERQFPAMKNHLRDEHGDLRRFVNIYLNSDDIRFAQGQQTAVKDGDEITIIPAIAGG